MLKAYFDRWEIVREKSFQYLLLESNIWADILTTDSLEQDVPRRLALAPPALVVLEQAEPPSFVPNGESLTQPPGGMVATAQIPDEKDRKINYARREAIKV
jgi:hypothetical protein